jgi:hypothetical protein
MPTVASTSFGNVTFLTPELSSSGLVIEDDARAGQEN